MINDTVGGRSTQIVLADLGAAQKLFDLGMFRPLDTLISFDLIVYHCVCDDVSSVWDSIDSANVDLDTLIRPAQSQALSIAIDTFRDFLLFEVLEPLWVIAGINYDDPRTQYRILGNAGPIYSIECLPYE